jgi:gamma-glutamylcysteine synthetase
MFSGFSNLLLGQRIKKLMKKLKIEVVQSEKDRIHLKSALFLQESRMRPLIKELEKEQGIRAVTYKSAEGSLKVVFDETLADEYGLIEKWLKKVEALSGK